MDNAWIIAFYKETDPVKRLELLKAEYRRRRVGERQIPETVMDCKIWKTNTRKR